MLTYQDLLEKGKNPQERIMSGKLNALRGCGLADATKWIEITDRSRHFLCSHCWHSLYADEPPRQCPKCKEKMLKPWENVRLG